MLGYEKMNVMLIDMQRFFFLLLQNVTVSRASKLDVFLSSVDRISTDMPMTFFNPMGCLYRYLPCPLIDCGQDFPMAYIAAPCVPVSTTYACHRSVVNRLDDACPSSEPSSDPRRRCQSAHVQHGEGPAVALTGRGAITKQAHRLLYL